MQVSKKQTFSETPKFNKNQQNAIKKKKTFSEIPKNNQNQQMQVRKKQKNDH